MFENRFDKPRNSPFASAQPSMPGHSGMHGRGNAGETTRPYSSPFAPERPVAEKAQPEPRAAEPRARDPFGDDLVRVFNTAIVATRAETLRDFSDELIHLMETPAFRAVLNAIRHHAISQGISDKDAAEAVIHAFRKIDRIWSDYVFQEGVDRLRSQMP